LIFTVGDLPKLPDTVTELDTDPAFAGVQPLIVALADVQPVSDAATAASRAVVAAMVAILRTLKIPSPCKVSL
jgi:hypothetical protein